MKFKNLRQPARAKKVDVSVPPLKRANTKVDLSPLSVPEYESHIKHLQKSYKSNKWSLSSMIALLEATSTQRRLWINKESPPVSEILEKFPCFEEPKLVGRIVPGLFKLN